MKSIVVLLALGVAACADVSAPLPRSGMRPTAPQNDIDDHTDTKDVMPWIVVACNGELVVGTAKQHIQTHYHENREGRLEISFDEHDELSGIGQQTLAKYHGQLEIKDKSGTNEGPDAHGATQYSTENRVKLEAEGKVPDSDVEIKTWFTDPGNGKPVKVKTEFKNRCH